MAKGFSESIGVGRSVGEYSIFFLFYLHTKRRLDSQAANPNVPCFVDNDCNSNFSATILRFKGHNQKPYIPEDNLYCQGLFYKYHPWTPIVKKYKENIA